MRKEKGGPDRPVSNNDFSSVTLNQLVVKARESIHVLLFRVSTRQSVQRLV